MRLKTRFDLPVIILVFIYLTCSPIVDIVVVPGDDDHHWIVMILELFSSRALNISIWIHLRIVVSRISQRIVIG